MALNSNMSIMKGEQNQQWIEGPRASSPTIDGVVLPPFEFELEPITVENKTRKNLVEDQPDIKFEAGKDLSPERQLLRLKISEEFTNLSCQLQLASPVTKEIFIEKALGMGEILQVIFTHLPTNLLLSSCSLVSRFWNTETRIFIRDHRICTFCIDGWDTACSMLQTLDEICGEITAHRRVIPFNRIILRDCYPDRGNPCCLNEQENSSILRSSEENISFKSSDDNINLSSRENASCLSSIKYNTSLNSPQNGCSFNSPENDCSSNSPETDCSLNPTEKDCSLNSPESDCSLNSSDSTSSLSSPGIDRIFNWSDYVSSLNWWGNTSRNDANLLSNLTAKLKLKFIKLYGHGRAYHKPLATLLNYKCCQLQSLRIEGTRFFQNIRTTLWYPQFPALEELSIAGKCFEDGSDEKLTDALRWMLKDAPNLKKFHLEDQDLLRIAPQEILSHLELPNNINIRLNTAEDMDVLRKIVHTKACPSHIRIYEPDSDYEDPYSDLVVDPDLHRQFDHEVGRILEHYQQHLEKVEIIGAYQLAKLSHPPLPNLFTLTVRKKFRGKLEELWNAIASINFERAMPRLNEVAVTIEPVPCCHDRDSFSEWPASNIVEQVIYCSTTVRNLKLDLEIQKVNLRPFQALFPNITVLHLYIRVKLADRTRDSLPLGMIWQCWPQLEEAKLFGWTTLNRNYDSDFCGIHSEEVNLLRGKGKEYLQNLQIVPIKPCVLTMPKLRTLCFSQGAGQHETFISDVTHCLVLQRMPQLDLNLPGKV